ncbi:MAG TPA: N-acetyltransferase [Thermomicrobiales bacterium]|nr:N-acetyltransferase [Thermomicrobiales bacterium]
MTADRDIRRRAADAPPPPPSPTARLGIDIGPVAWSELSAVAQLQRRAFRSSLAYRLPTLAMLRLWPRARFLVARRGRRILGCAIGDRHAGESRVVNLAVDPDARRLGIGSALLAALEAALPEGDLSLMVEADNLGAQALYRAAGYIPTGQSANYYGPGRHGIWMRKRREARGERREAREPFPPSST